MAENQTKNTRNTRERIMGFIYVSLLFLGTTTICCMCLFYYNSNQKMMTQKEFAIAKMDRIRSFQDIQSNEMVIVDSIYKKIKAFNPSVNASYEENDIKFYLNDLKNIYEKNSYDGRYKIFAQVSNFYSMWFDDKKELWTKKQNIGTFRKNLENCEIGLQKKTDELKNIKN